MTHRTLVELSDCHVFKIGPRPSAEGYKAENWYKDEIHCGPLKVLDKGSTCEIVLLKGNSNKTFAKCVVTPKSVERVIDSSRYFVLRIERGKKHAFIGIGFQERSEAFDFKDALEQKIAEELKTIPTQDYRMKEGEKIKKVKTNEVVHENVDILGENNSKKSGVKKKFDLSIQPPTSKGRKKKRKNKKKKITTTGESKSNDGLFFM